MKFGLNKILEAWFLYQEVYLKVHVSADMQLESTVQMRINLFIYTVADLINKYLAFIAVVGFR